LAPLARDAIYTVDLASHLSISLVATASRPDPPTAARKQQSFADDSPNQLNWIRSGPLCHESRITLRAHPNNASSRDERTPDLRATVAATTLANHFVAARLFRAFEGNRIGLHARDRKKRIRFKFNSKPHSPLLFSLQHDQPPDD
jgi:hypothetical protein